MNYTYGAEDDEEDVSEYDLSYFFGEDSVLEVPTSQLERQLCAQYPSEDVISRCAVMWYFDDDAQARINRMWINIRCFDLKEAHLPIVFSIVLVVLLIVLLIVRQLVRNRGEKNLI